MDIKTLFSQSTKLRNKSPSNNKIIKNPFISITSSPKPIHKKIYTMDAKSIPWSLKLSKATIVPFLHTGKQAQEKPIPCKALSKSKMVQNNN
jgi:hypothetical protein